MSLLDLFSPGKGIDAANAAYAATKKGYKTGLTNATNAITAGTDKAAGYYGQALTGYDPATGTYKLLGDALGVNGQPGYDAATSAFHTAPGYDFQMGQGIDALNRTAASRGLLSSGNNTEDILKFSQGLADQSYQQWLDNLSGLGSGQTSLASAKGGVYGNLANLFSNQGTDLAKLNWDAATGIGTAGAQRAANRFAAEDAANQNQMGLLQNGVGAAAKLFALA